MLLILGSIGCATTLLICFMSYTEAADSAGRDWIFNLSVFAFIVLFEISHGPVWYLSSV